MSNGIDFILQAAQLIDKNAEIEKNEKLKYNDDRFAYLDAKKNQALKDKHTEIERSRRADFRFRMDSLKAVVPLGRKMQKFTIKKLLVEAKQYIETLKRREKEYKCNIQDLRTKNYRLRQRYLQLEQLSKLENTLLTCQPPHTQSNPCISVFPAINGSRTPVVLCASRETKTKPQPSWVTSQVQPGPNRMVTIHIKKTLPGNRKRGGENVGGPQKKNQTFDLSVL